MINRNNHKPDPDYLTGKRFARLTVTGFAGRTNNYRKLWKCKCDCGKEILVTESHLKSGGTKSCGCLKKDILSKPRVDIQEFPEEDLTGKVFGELTVIGFSHREKYNNYWNCKCSCGKECKINEYRLRIGTVKSCGHLKNHRDLIGKRYGRLTVLESTDKRKYRYVVWKCRCDCGEIVYTTTSALTTGVVTSCDKCKHPKAGDLYGQQNSKE